MIFMKMQCRRIIHLLSNNRYIIETHIKVLFSNSKINLKIYTNAEYLSILHYLAGTDWGCVFDCVRLLDQFC